MSISEKLKELDRKVSEATKSIQFRNYLPVLLYALTFFLIDLFYCRTLLIKVDNYPWEISLSKIVWSNIIALSALIYILPKKASAAVFAASAAICHAYGFSQLCYSCQDNNLFRLNTISVMGEGMKYMGGILKGMSAGTLLGFFGIFLLIAAVTVFTLKFTRDPEKGLARTVKTIFCLIIFIPTMILVLLIPTFMDKDSATGFGSYTAYNYRNFLSAVDMYNDTDILMLLQRDVVCTVKGAFVHSSGMEAAEEYFSSRPEHIANDKTDIFKGKNLICVMMESLDYTGLTEENCPNLTRMMNEGINFSNFYSVRFGDAFTFGTELCVNTGIANSSGFAADTDAAESPFPLSLGFLFRNNGYTANEFHYNDPDFYNRGKMSRVFGYENYIRYADHAEDKSLDFEIDDTLVTDEALYAKLTEGDKFLDYVVTYSAHMPYDIDGSIYLEAIRRHPELAVSDPSDKTGIFKAKAALTDDMAGKLVERLEEDGKLDDTVIFFFADHYCSAILDIDGDELFCRTPCFIYAKGITPETVDKVCNTTDILPTLANMFGVGNSDDYAGYDIFSDSYEGYAFFPNLSWVTSEGMFLQGSGVQSFGETELSDEYIEQMNETALNRLNVNTSIICSDYYRKKQAE